MSYDERLGDYNDVASRMREFFEKYPEGRLRPASPWRFETVGDRSYVVYEAAAYRTPDDALPGIGTAWEPFPGRTPYTKDSELMNAETSAWGRAILAVGAADTRKGIASAEEVRNRQADREHSAGAQPARWPSPKACLLYGEAHTAGDAEELRVAWERVQLAGKAGLITAEEAGQIKAHIKARGEELAKPEPEQPAEPVEDRTAEPADEPSGAEPDEQQPMDGDWPEPAKPGQDPA
ncbi:hypothetical protein [Micromonospora chersina]